MAEVQYTAEEKKLIEEYEKNTGKRIGNKEERYEQFKRMSPMQRESFYQGVQNALWARLDLNNDFDSEGDSWKEKVLRENLSMLEQIAIEEASK